MKKVLDFVQILVLVIFFLQCISSDNVKKSVDENRDDNGDPNDDGKDESMDIPFEVEQNNVTCTRRQNSQMHEIRQAKIKQFPFMAAIMSQQHEYLCAGSLVANGLILTTANCFQKPINYVLLNTTFAKKDDKAVVLHIVKSEKFPTFSGVGKDVGLIYTEKHNNTFATKLSLSNITAADQLVDVEALGFGLNADAGQVKELQYVGLENRLTHNEYYIAFIDCVETKLKSCFKDTGGPVIYENQLVGVVVKGQNDCTREISSRYAINKQMIEFLPSFTFKAWIEERLKKYEEQEAATLMTYPSKPILRQVNHVLTTSINRNISQRCSLSILPIYLLTLLTYL
ncbi:unnamed protein product [Parnassius apollo]|uniref:(apollo) hypothetical protein n=1 Tax=Parnassius apollo TaxID=110799 RepID=A0A8S3XZ96_PARAO|nr:unnamed protein product [Parnassius apollo]